MFFLCSPLNRLHVCGNKRDDVCNRASTHRVFRCEGSRLKKRISTNVFKLCIRTCDTCDTCAHFYCPFGRGQTAIDDVNHAIFDAAEYRDISGSDIFTNVACVT